MKAHLLILAAALVLTGGQFAQANSDVRQPLNFKSSEDPAINDAAKKADQVQSGETCPLIKAAMAEREANTVGAAATGTATLDGKVIH